ncbi:MAG: response regulator [Chloroflexales bacterium]|nr:response regulator [Chloroflexales bacterium]
MLHHPYANQQRGPGHAHPTILVGDDDANFCRLLTLLLSGAGYSVLTAHDGHALVSLAQEHMPDLLLVDLVMPRLDGYEALRQLRNDTRTAHIPMIVVTNRGAPADLVSGFESGADDYVTKPVIGDELIARIKGHLRRAARRPVHSPLTGLPGNSLLTEEIRYRQRRAHPFALLHLDLSAFKAFNDTYGFARGDQAIRALAEVLRAALSAHHEQGAFLGHIGGDDFAFVCAPERAEALCRSAIAHFDAIAPSLYDEADRALGYLEAIDRDGELRRFPLMALAVGGAFHIPGRFADPEALGRCVAAMKQQAKQHPASAYVISPSDDLPPLEGPSLLV